MIDRIADLVYLLCFGAMFGFSVSWSKRKRTVARSIERQKASISAIKYAGLAATLGAVLSALDSAQGDVKGYAIDMIFTLLWLIVLTCLLKDDDWFNGQRKRFRRRLSDLRKRQRRAVRVPEPSPT